MQVSTKGRYAVMSLIDLATLQGEEKQPVTLALIAERQDLSLSYLEQLFAKLRRAGLVKSVRGPGGGYVLANSEQDTYLGSIIAAVAEETDLTRCGGCETDDKQPNEAIGGCVYGNKCNAHDIWVALSEHMRGFLDQLSIHMVLQGQLTVPGVFTPAAGTHRKVSVI